MICKASSKHAFKKLCTTSPSICLFFKELNYRLSVIEKSGLANWSKAENRTKYLILAQLGYVSLIPSRKESSIK